MTRLLATIAVLLVCCAAIPARPHRVWTDLVPYMLAAPWTGFNEDGSVNPNVIEEQAKFHKKEGVTCVWVSGSMAQWQTMTVEERMEIADLWVKYGHQNDLLVYIHVGHQSLQVAVELAKHAEKIGADGIAMLPPYSPQAPATVDILAEMVGLVSNSVDLPMFYYHIPRTTNVNFPMTELLRLAQKSIPRLEGVKFVVDNDTDYVLASKMNAPSGVPYNMMWAGNPKLHGIELGARSFVLAEGFYAPYVRATFDAYAIGDMKAANETQAKHDALSKICGPGGKAIMAMLGVDLGPERLPDKAISRTKYDDIRQQLIAFGFLKE